MRKNSKEDAQVDPLVYSSVNHGSPKKVKIRVYLIDNDFKTIFIEHDSKVKDLLELVAGKMGIEDCENFGLFEEWKRNNKTEERLLHNEQVLNELWNKKTEKKIVLKCRVFRELSIINSNEATTYLYYIQTKSNILSGYYFAGLNNAIVLGMLQMQIEFGPYSAEKHKIGFMQSRIRDFVSTFLLEKYGGKQMEYQILQAYSQSTNKSLLLLKKCYVLEAMKLAVFGCRFFSARQKKTRTLPEILMVGVSSNGVTLVKSDTKEFLRQWKFNDLYRWGFTDSAFYLQLRSMKESSAGSIWELFSSEGEQICELLNIYQSCILHDIESLPERLMFSEEIAVIKIQACWKGYLLRKRLAVVQKILACKVIASEWLKSKNG